MKDKRTYSKGLSRDDIANYRNGSEAQRRETEGRADAFDQDALDGWSTSQLSVEQGMKRIDKQFHKSSTGRFYYYGMAAVLLIGTLSWFFISQQTNKFNQKNPDLVQLRVEETDIVLAPAIDSMAVLPEAKQITVATVRTSQQEIQQLPESVPVTDIREIPTEILPQKEVEVKVPEKTIVTQKTGKEIYSEGLKLIDYSAYRHKPVIETEQRLLTGTPADQEKESAEETEVEITTVDIPYMDYIRKTAKYISKGKWKDALQRLNIIIEAYPDDVNGHFYAGLCSYNLRQYKDAANHFRSCLQLDFNNFNEEASWYLALSILAEGKKEQAQELLTIIRDQKGYYAKQAANLLKELK